jgi:chromosome condensin MukBEF ATPase and DNA-binding subunit MukB
MSTINAAYKAAEQTQQSLSSELHALRSEGRRRLDECNDEASKLRQSLLHAQAELHRYATVLHSAKHSYHCA